MDDGNTSGASARSTAGATNTKRKIIMNRTQFRGGTVKRSIAMLISICLALFYATALAGDPVQRFTVVVERMVDAINAQQHSRIQHDFGMVLREAFPLSKSKPFFKDLISSYGKIERLAAPRLIPPNQAIFPAHMERAILDIKVVLDQQDKIIGLWFLPHAAQIPVPEEHKTVLRLPFSGQWRVAWGGDTKALNQHHDVPNQRYAFDFLQIDDNGKTHRKGGRHNEDYYAFGQKVLAPADGVVTDVIRGVRDNAPGTMNPYMGLGNTVIIQHADYEVSVLAHFKQDSIMVAAGDRVTRGQVLGLCGNSGNSSEPHIHYHLQNTPVIQDGQGIKCFFNNLRVLDGEIVRSEAVYSPVKNEIIENSASTSPMKR